MDLVSVLSLYEKYRRQCEVTIIISSTLENLEFLRGSNLPESALRYLEFETRGNKNKKRVASYLRQLFTEKRMLNTLAREICESNESELFFHSYHDPHAAYLVSRVGKTNKVTFVDVLRIKPSSLGDSRHRKNEKCYPSSSNFKHGIGGEDYKKGSRRSGEAL